MTESCTPVSKSVCFKGLLVCLCLHFLLQSTPLLAQGSKQQRDRATQAGLFPQPEKPKPESPFHLRTPGTPAERLEEAKAYLARVQEWNKWAVVSYLDRVSAGITLKGSDPRIIKVKEQFEKDGFLPPLPKKSTSKPKKSTSENTSLDPIELQMAHQAANTFSLHIPFERVRLAYSDVIRECRDRNQLNRIDEIEAEGTEFLKNAGYSPIGKPGQPWKIESWKDLYSYDFEIATQCVTRGNIWAMELYGHRELSKEYREKCYLEQQEWIKQRIGVGLALPESASSVKGWRLLEEYHMKREVIQAKMAPLLEQSGLAGAGVILGLFAMISQDGLQRDGETVEDAMARNERASDAVDRGVDGLGQKRVADQSLKELRKELMIAEAPLKDFQMEYATRRAAELGLKESADGLKFTLSPTKLTVTNTTAEYLGEVTFFLSANATAVPAKLETQLLAAQKKAEQGGGMSPKLELLNKEVDRLFGIYDDLRAPFNAQWNVVMPASGSITLMSHDYLDARPIKIYAISGKFTMSTEVFPSKPAAKK